MDEDKRVGAPKTEGEERKLNRISVWMIIVAVVLTMGIGLGLVASGVVDWISSGTDSTSVPTIGGQNF